jgi:flagellar motor switch protein FliN/FliY
MRKSALLKSLPLPVAVTLARIPASSDLPALGSIIDLQRRVADPVELSVNGQVIARGVVVVADDFFAVEITEIVGEEAQKEAA